MVRSNIRGNVMKDLLQEVKELEEVIDHHTKVGESYQDTAPDCESAIEAFQLAVWLTELLEIKKARLSVEVFFHQEYDLEPDPEDDEEELTESQCPRCRQEAFVERGPKLICSNCGNVKNIGADNEGDR